MCVSQQPTKQTLSSVLWWGIGCGLAPLHSSLARHHPGIVVNPPGKTSGTIQPNEGEIKGRSFLQRSSLVTQDKYKERMALDLFSGTGSVTKVDIAGNGRSPADPLVRAWDGRRDLAVDLTIVHPNPATVRPLRGSVATFLRDKGKQKNRESAALSGRMGVDFSPMVFDTWGGLHGAGKDVVKAIFARCTASFLPGARPAAVAALRQGLSVQLGRFVPRQLEALKVVATETSTWWAAALPAAPTFTAAGNPQW